MCFPMTVSKMLGVIFLFPSFLFVLHLLRPFQSNPPLSPFNLPSTCVLISLSGELLPHVSPLSFTTSLASVIASGDLL